MIWPLTIFGPLCSDYRSTEWCREGAGGVSVDPMRWSLTGTTNIKKWNSGLCRAKGNQDTTAKMREGAVATMAKISFYRRLVLAGDMLDYNDCLMLCRVNPVWAGRRTDDQMTSYLTSIPLPWHTSYWLRHDFVVDLFPGIQYSSSSITIWKLGN